MVLGFIQENGSSNLISNRPQAKAEIVCCADKNRSRLPLHNYCCKLKKTQKLKTPNLHLLSLSTFTCSLFQTQPDITVCMMCGVKNHRLGISLSRITLLKSSNLCQVSSGKDLTLCLILAHHMTLQAT